MRKSIRGKTCVYCGISPATTRDHVVPRGMMLVRNRGDNVHVPACLSCNHTKSEIEAYLAFMLLRAGKHEDAYETYQTLAPAIQQGNKKLLNQVKEGQERILVFDQQSPFGRPATSVLLEPAKLEGFLKCVVQALTSHHFDLVLSPHNPVRVFASSPAGDAHLNELMAGKTFGHVQGDIGKGTLSYHGYRCVEFPEMTVWSLSLFGGVQMNEEELVIRHMVGMSGSKEFMDQISSKIRPY